MKKKFAYIIILSLSFILIGSNNIVGVVKKNPLSEDDINYYALIVACEKFKGLEYNDTVCIDEDAIAMYNKLLQSLNWKEDNIKLLINENATKEKIIEAIGCISENETENDVVLFYYSGHGWKTKLTDRKHGNAYLFTYNNTDFAFDENDISDKELDLYLDELDSNNVIVIIDHCYSGKMFSLNQKGRIILAAGGRFLLCIVDEDSTLGHGMFTYFILQGLDGVADINNDDWVSAKEVFRYSRFPTFWFSLWKQMPVFFPQLPFMYSKNTPDIPFYQYKLAIT